VLLMAGAVIAAKDRSEGPRRVLQRRAHAPAGAECHECYCAGPVWRCALAETELLSGARRSTMDELATATLEADKVLVF
jgi:uncharacterized protein involved in oxidation of intracellular sulfur